MWTITLHISLTSLLTNHDHAQLKQGLNQCKGGHEQLVKSYKKLQQEMQGLITCGDTPTGATVPNQLSSERLWDLDVDDDLWTDLASGTGRATETCQSQCTRYSPNCSSFYLF